MGLFLQVCVFTYNCKIIISLNYWLLVLVLKMMYHSIINHNRLKLEVKGHKHLFDEILVLNFSCISMSKNCHLIPNTIK
jgi:hypothetical protein